MTEISLRDTFDHLPPASREESAHIQAALNQDRQSRRYGEVLTIRQGLLARQQRGRFFNPKLFADPAWDMLLELYAASLTERRMTVSRLAERSGVPLTTALRWIAILEQEELIDREADRFDRRRIYLSLTDKGRSAMSAYFEELHPDAKLL
jgi:DNA-binding MarR family transcriptional regulator